jgi:hypothetical protein
LSNKNENATVSKTFQFSELNKALANIFFKIVRTELTHLVYHGLVKCTTGGFSYGFIFQINF